MRPTLSRRLSLARSHGWTRVVFLSDLLVLCDDVLSSDQPQLWAISSLVAHIRTSLEEFSEWRIA